MPKRKRDAAAAQPHDSLVKFAFSQLEHAAGLLKAVLDADIVRAVAWDTLVLENQTFVDRGLRGRYIDLLFSARMHGGERAYFYALVEQQRKVEPLMILRVGVYAFRAWERIVKDAPDLKKIPPIVPILIHHSDTGWTAATAFHDIVAVPESLRPVDAPTIVHLLETTASKGQKKVIMDELDVFRVEGRAEGRARTLLELLRARFGPVPSEAKAKILAAKEPTLARWSLRVLSEPTLKAVLDDRAKKVVPARRGVRAS